MKILITGIAGQDGSYLAEDFLKDGHVVDGIVRRPNNWRLDEIPVESKKHLRLFTGDIQDPQFMHDIFSRNDYDQVYHLAAQTHVGASFNMPKHTMEVNLMATQVLLEAIRSSSEVLPNIYFASTSEVFGNESELISTPGDGDHLVQTIDTSMRPVSPYGIAKLAAQQLCEYYRRAYGFSIGIGILFNHESPRRGEEFVTRKITSTLARISHGADEYLELGDITSSRDFGWAPQYAQIMRTICQRGTTELLATGDSHSIQEFLKLALELLNVPQSRVQIGIKQFTRPCDVKYLRGVSTIPFNTAVPFEGIVEQMCIADMIRVRKK